MYIFFDFPIKRIKIPTIYCYIYIASLCVPLDREPKRITFWIECFFANIVISRKTLSGRLQTSPLAQIFSSGNSIITAPLFPPIFILTSYRESELTRQPLEFSQVYDFSVANDRWDVNQGMKKATGWLGSSL